MLAKASVSARRIDIFLNCQERNSQNANVSDEVNNHSKKHENEVPSRNSESKMPSIRLEKVSAKWSTYSEEETLKNLDIHLKNGRLTAVIGQVASGKSSLLQLILNELPVSSGKVDVVGKISYASQEPWVFASSVRQNILFGLPMDKERYDKVITVCQMHQDMRTFSFGDQTLIGEKGIKLSGGQRARINLARAVYSEADIYLLDDPLSAVDPEVGKRIFEECICGFLKNKTRILVTHQLQYLKSVDDIIVLNNGSLDQQGTLDEILQSGLDFLSILQVKKEDKGETAKKDIVSIHRIENGILPEDEEHMKQEEISELKNVSKYSKRVFWSYLNAGGNIWIPLLTLVLGFTYQTFLSGNDYFLSRWMNAEEEMADNKEFNNTSILFEEIEKEREWYINAYSILLVLIVISLSSFCFMFFEMSMRSARGLHKSMFNKVIRAKMLFFHENPSGRILNR